MVVPGKDPEEDHTANDQSTAGTHCPDTRVAVIELTRMTATHDQIAKVSGTGSMHPIHDAANSEQGLPTANQFKKATSSNPVSQQPFSQDNL